MRSPLSQAICAGSLALAICVPAPAVAGPAESSLWIEVSRDAGAVFNGFPLPREGEGMGVVVRSHEVATAAHVVWGAQTILLVDAGGTQSAARVEHIDKDADVALLRVERRLGHPVAIRSRKVVTGEPVAAVRWRRSNGTARQVAGTVWATRWTSNGVAVPTILTGIKGEKGMSGGGLFDAGGQLVGIVIRIDRTLGYLSALPVAELSTRFDVS